MTVRFLVQRMGVVNDHVTCSSSGSWAITRTVVIWSDQWGLAEKLAKERSEAQVFTQHSPVRSSGSNGARNQGGGVPGAHRELGP